MLRSMINYKCSIELFIQISHKALIKYIADEDKIEKILSNQQVIKTPVVRMGNKAAVGFEPEKWKEFI